MVDLTEDDVQQVVIPVDSSWQLVGKWHSKYKEMEEKNEILKAENEVLKRRIEELERSNKKMKKA